MTTQEHDVPKYFLDFVQENARQHQELAATTSQAHQDLAARLTDSIQENARQNQHLTATIHQVKGELKIIRIVGIAILVAVLGLWGTGLTAFVTYIINL